MKIDKEILTFGNIEIQKNKFFHHDTPISSKDVDIEKVLVSQKISVGEKNYKYVTGYLHNDHKVKPLHIMLPNTRAYVKSFDGETKWMYFLTENDDLLEKYNAIWDKVSADIKKEFDSEPVYNKSFLKAKIKLRGIEVTDFYDKKIPKVDSNHNCLAVICLDSALKKDDNYYTQVFLKECNTLQKRQLGILLKLSG